MLCKSPVFFSLANLIKQGITSFIFVDGILKKKNSYSKNQTTRPFVHKIPNFKALK